MNRLATWVYPDGTEWEAPVDEEGVFPWAIKYLKSERIIVRWVDKKGKDI